MSKTKEEIIKEHYSCRCAPIYSSREMLDPDCVLHNELYEMELMMDEYAKGVSISFAEWIVNHELDFQPTHEPGIFIGVDMVKITSADLFTIFLTQNKD